MSMLAPPPPGLDGETPGPVVDQATAVAVAVREPGPRAPLWQLAMLVTGAFLSGIWVLTLVWAGYLGFLWLLRAA